MKISGWGRYPLVEAEIEELRYSSVLKHGADGSVQCIARGLGRSYGDSSLAARIVLTPSSNRILSFDGATGELTCEAGMSLDEIVKILLPRGWFPEITPGTRYVTVGGAIASDVHGKNHHRCGCFSESVRSFRLLLPDGSIVGCSRDENIELFRATCGGMGLTGIILDATVRLQPVRSAFIEQQTFAAANLDEALAFFQEQSDWAYSVAWIDCLASGKQLGRSILMVGRHAREGALYLGQKRKISVPFSLPGIFLHRYTVSAFNALYYSRKARSAGESSLVDFNSFFYPLDALENWNRIYGRSGFVQYQFVLPLESSRQGLMEVLAKISQSGQGSFLAVLKLFGPGNENYLSFPREGYTLALDFKITGSLFVLLDELDTIVTAYGGRLYLTKDARMKPGMLRSGYPRLDRFLDIRKKISAAGMFESRQSIRLGI